jgi:beta-glucosidase
MCAYNRLGGTYACESEFLLNRVLRDDWDFPGYVLSDWGAAHSTAAAAAAGLDQESGFGLQRAEWFGADKLKAALAAGEISEEQIDLMAARILRSMFAHGAIDHPVAEGGEIDVDRNRDISRQAAEAGIVLLKNEAALLPLTGARRIAVIGGHADKGVLSGGGSSQVYPDGTNAVPGIAPTTWPGPVVYYPSSPLEELRRLLPQATLEFTDGSDPVAAARLAAQAGVAIVFGTQWASESIDVPLSLGEGQDALIEAVAAANDNTIVVLQTGGPVLMPWANDVPAIIAAWYPGRIGGAAIARVLTGAVNPSGHLPATFPASLDQLPWPGEARTGEITYTEGAAVGYKWFDENGHEPLFPFGHGLSYTTFHHDHLVVAREGDGLVAMVEVTNTGERAGADVVQVYVSGRGWEAPRRLGGFAKVALEPGERKTIEIHIDPRLLAEWYADRPGWTHAAGAYTVAVAHSSRDLGETLVVELPPMHLPRDWRPPQ